MLLITYNSNPQNNPDLHTIRGWSLYTLEDWQSLWMDVDSYFSYLPSGDAELEFNVKGIGSVYYDCHTGWFNDYQVSEIDINKPYFSLEIIENLDLILGTNFYVPYIFDDPIYPEMDVD